MRQFAFKRKTKRRTKRSENKNNVHKMDYEILKKADCGEILK